jgi:hypothetical protein
MKLGGIYEIQLEGACHGPSFSRFLSFNALDSGPLVMAVHDMYVHGEFPAQVFVIHCSRKLLCASMKFLRFSG